MYRPLPDCKRRPLCLFGRISANLYWYHLEALPVTRTPQCPAHSLLTPLCSVCVLLAGDPNLAETSYIEFCYNKIRNREADVWVGNSITLHDSHLNRYTQPKPSRERACLTTPPTLNRCSSTSELSFVKILPQDMGPCVPLSLSLSLCPNTPSPPLSRDTLYVCGAAHCVHNTGLLMRQEDRQLAMAISAALLFLNSQPIGIELMERFFRLGQVIHPLQPTLSLTSAALAACAHRCDRSGVGV